MRILKTKLFRKYQNKEGISDSSLRKAANELHSGLYEANLGGQVYKKRLAKPGKGRSGSTRSIIAYKSDERLIFMFGFSKNDTNNLTEEELAYLKKLAKYFLCLIDQEINFAIKTNELQELDDA